MYRILISAFFILAIGSVSFGQLPVLDEPKAEGTEQESASLKAEAKKSNNEVVVASGQEWRWLHPTDGTDPAEDDPDFHTTFFKPDFDDAKWEKGKDSDGENGGFGYGQPVPKVSIGEPLQENRKSAYFRLKFKTDKPYEKLMFQCQRDDGVIVYLDGKEVIRDNVPKGKDKYALFAETTVASQNEVKVNRMPFKHKLEPGEHTLAISLHNRAGGSSDLRIAEMSLVVATDEDFKRAEMEARARQAAREAQERAARQAQEAQDDDDLF